MKILTRIISLLMVALMLITTVPFTPVSAVNGSKAEYTLTIENTYADSFLAQSSAVGAMSFFGSAEFDGCYGNQLSDVAREIYDSLVKNYATDKKTVEYTYTFDTPFTFDAEISGDNIVMNDELEAAQLEIQYAAQAAMDAFLYDHPEVFWLKKLSTSYGISASGNSVDGYTGIIEAVTIIPDEIYAGASDKASQYDAAVESALVCIAVTQSRYETLKNIHNYICDNAWYNLVNEQRVHSSEPFFIGDKGVVCEGYAKAFKVLCDESDIPCVLVSGDAGGAHMWNYVQMDDGKWYLIDVTWDDQDSRIYDTYFLANANTIGFNDVTISEERAERNDFSGTGVFSFTYPVLSSTAYTFHVHEWENYYTIDAEPTCTVNGSKSIHCKTCEAKKDVIIGYATGHCDYNKDKHCDNCEEYLTTIAKTGRCGENVYWEFCSETGTLELSGYGTMWQYVWDETPFSYDELKTVYIKGNIDNIGQCAFNYCKNLENVTIENGVKHIDMDAFCGCEKLKNITLPDSVIAIGNFAFENCSGLEKITLGNRVVSIGDGAFDGCSALDEIVLPVALERIGDTFYRCSGLAVRYKGDIYQWMKVDGWESVSDYFNVITEAHIHTEAVLEGKTATCTDKGLTEGKWCTVCSVITERQEVIPAKGHKGGIATCKNKAKCTVCGEEYGSLKAHVYKTTVKTKATITKNGQTVEKCSCGAVKSKSEKTIYYPKTIKLEYTSVTYNGKTKTPYVTVKDYKGNKLKKHTDYTVKYASGRKSTGKYSVTITFKGKYSGTKTLYFNILPSKTSKLTPACSTTEIKASWKSVTGASGYKVELLNSKGKVVKSVTTTKTYYTFKKLSKVTTYKIRVTAYKTIDKKAVYSSVSTTITTSTAPAKVSLSKVTAGSKSATPAWKTVSGASGYQVQYSTSSKFKSAKTATVSKGSSKKTTIKKLTKGKKYYFKVRAYKTVGSVKVYGAWSSVKSVRVK